MIRFNRLHERMKHSLLTHKYHNKLFCRALSNQANNFVNPGSEASSAGEDSSKNHEKSSHAEENEESFPSTPPPQRSYKPWLFFFSTVGGLSYLASSGYLSEWSQNYLILQPLLSQGVSSLNDDFFNLGGQLGQLMLMDPNFRLKLTSPQIQAVLIEALFSNQTTAKQQQALITIYMALLSMDAMDESNELEVTRRLSLNPELIQGFIHILQQNAVPIQELHTLTNITAIQLDQFNQIAAGTWLCLKHLFQCYDKFPLSLFDFLRAPGKSFAKQPRLFWC
jgi:hypothetical protein